MPWPDRARKWELDDITREARIAASHFRDRRLGEPKERYLKAFALLEAANKALLGSLYRLKERPVDREWLAKILDQPVAPSTDTTSPATPCSQLQGVQMPSGSAPWALPIVDHESDWPRYVLRV